MVASKASVGRGGADPVLGRGLGDAQQSRIVLVSKAGRPQLLEHLLDGRRQRYRDVRVRRRREGDLEILVVKIHSEPGGEVVLEEVATADFHDSVARHTAGEGV